MAFQGNVVVGFSVNTGNKRKSFAAPGKGHYTLFKKGPEKNWTLAKFPILVRGIMMAKNQVLVAGVPDKPNPKGGILRRLSLASGEKLEELVLKAAPVFDGMALGENNLYVTTEDGSLICIGKK